MLRRPSLSSVLCTQDSMFVKGRERQRVLVRYRSPREHGLSNAHPPRCLLGAALTYVKIEGTMNYLRGKTG
jgi:hypothetical protein